MSRQLSQWSYADANGNAVPSHTRRLFEAIGHPDKEMYEITRANHYYSGPDQRGPLRKAASICTDRLHRHGFSSEGWAHRRAGESVGPTAAGQGTTGESTP